MNESLKLEILKAKSDLEMAEKNQDWTACALAHAYLTQLYRKASCNLLQHVTDEVLEEMAGAR